MQLRLQTVICSTRPGRIGPSVAKWFNDFAGQQGSFDSELVDIADYHLPVYDEPNHPRQQDYQQEHTKAWSPKSNRQMLMFLSSLSITSVRRRPFLMP